MPPCTCTTQATSSFRRAALSTRLVVNGFGAGSAVGLVELHPALCSGRRPRAIAESSRLGRSQTSSSCGPQLRAYYNLFTLLQAWAASVRFVLPSLSRPGPSVGPSLLNAVRAGYAMDWPSERPPAWRPRRQDGVSSLPRDRRLCRCSLGWWLVVGGSWPRMPSRSSRA